MGGLEKTNSYLGKAQSDLSKLCSALGLDASWQKVNEALELSMHPWGKEEIPKEPCNWLSEMALDHSPIEVSILPVPLLSPVGFGNLGFCYLPKTVLE